MYHFHLAAVINPASDIALLSTIPTSSAFGRHFQLQWLNNKEVQFSASLEVLMNEILSKNKDKDKSDESLASNTEDYSFVDRMEIDGDIEINEETGVEEKNDQGASEGGYIGFC